MFFIDYIERERFFSAALNPLRKSFFIGCPGDGLAIG